MKKIAIIGALLSSFFSKTLLGGEEASRDLKARLDKISNLHATFIQTVKNANGKTLQECQGELWLKRPNLFRWQMSQPDESVLVSDGKRLWFYDPVLEQVTITWLKDNISDTPFMLIASDRNENWQQYRIKQTGNIFELTPKNANTNLKQFIINVSRNGRIQQFCTIDQENQRISYQLKTLKSTGLTSTRFIFIPPKGITVDDQRH